MTKTTTRLLLLAATAVLPLAACQSTQNAATAVQSAAQAQLNPTLSTTDATFINSAAASGLAEVQDGQLAASKASSPAVRRFANQMVTDHTRVNSQLMQLAQAKQFSPPTSLLPADQQTYEQLQGMRGRAFDRAYMDGQVQAHQSAVQLFQTEAQSGTDPDVRAFAQQTLPALQQHLAMAQRLAPAH